MFDLELSAHAFGGGAPKPPGETGEARTARLAQREQQGVDARALRLRRARIAKGQTRSDLLGSGEASSLGAGL